MMEIAVGTVLLIIGLVMLIAVDNDGQFLIPIGLLSAGMGFALIADFAYNDGKEKGAYGMLRNEYEISYVINSDSVVTDTIINIK